MCLLTGCGLFISSGGRATRYFVLDIRPCSVDESAEPIAKGVLVNDPVSSAFLNSQRVIFSATPETRGAYQFAAWVDPPPKRLGSLIVNRLECSRLFQSVLKNPAYANADLALQTELIDFHHDTSSEPGQAVVKLQAELYDLSSRKVLGSKEISASAPVASFDIDGAVPALSKASSQVLDELTDWLKAVARKK